jgi:hypothetical protein
MRTFALTVAVIFSFVVLVPPASAQSSTHSASSAALDALVQQHLDSVAADRAAVAALLARPEVEKIAGGAGLDLRTAQGAIASLSSQELAQLASQARQAEQGLGGGQSKVTISTTTIIIGLLVLILLIVALR